MAFIVALRDRGVRPISCNSWLRALNAFCRWLQQEGRLSAPATLPQLKVETRFVRTLDGPTLRTILNVRPKGYAQWRVCLTACTILDTGCRIDEVLSAQKRHFDYEHLLLSVIGKGDKQRIVPFSLELRKRLTLFEKVKARVPGDLMLPARDGGKWHVRNARRSYYLLLDRLGVPRSGFHCLRHTFATHYLQSGGDVVRLSKILGHTHVTTTMRYLHLLTEDLSASHERLSVLNRFR